jgi:hypothetical protein
MTRLNKQGREIWFDRWFWGYMPCHWKGWAVIAAIAFGAIAARWLLVSFLHAGSDNPRPFIVMLPIIVLPWIVAERHSPSRS